MIRLRPTIIILTIFCILIKSPVSLQADLTINSDETKPVVKFIGSEFDAEGNLIVVGETTDRDLYVGKYKDNGALLWDLYFGGTGDEFIGEFVVHPSGKILVFGITNSIDLGIIPNEQDLSRTIDIRYPFLVMISPDGNIEWSNYIGNEGFGEFLANTDDVLQIDSQGDIVVSYLIKPNELIVSPGFGEQFGSEVTKVKIVKMRISDDNSIQTMYEYSLEAVLKGRTIVKIDNEDNLILSGSTFTDLNSMMNGHQKILIGKENSFLFKLSNTLSVLSGTYFGSGISTLKMVLIGIDNSILLLAESNSDGYTKLDGTTNLGNGDVLIGKFDPSGSLLWANRFGGSGLDYIVNGEIDYENNLIFTGFSKSRDIALKSAFSDKYNVVGENYVVKYSPDGNTIFSTFVGNFGGRVNVVNIQMALSQDGTIILGSDTGDENQLTINSYQAEKSGFDDAYFLIIDPLGDLIASTYLGGSGIDVSVALKLDNADNLILMGTSGSTDFPTTDGSVVDGLTDVYIAKFDLDGELIYSKLIGGDRTEQFNQNTLRITENNDLLIFGVTNSNSLDGLGDEEINFLETWGYVTKISEDGEITWTSAMGIARIEKEYNYNMILLLLIVSGILSIGSILFVNRYRFTTSKTVSSSWNKQISNILSPIFDSKPRLIYLFTGTTLLDDSSKGRISSEVPQAILEYKDLMQPVRLAMIKLLYDNTQMTTIELREAIGVDRVELNNHLVALKKKDYLHLEQVFRDGIIKTVVQLQPHTLKQFQKLKDVLIGFLSGSPDIGTYLEQAIEIQKKTTDDNLYPANN